MHDKNRNQNLCDLLAAYELGLLENDECSSFENHLTACPECTEELYAMAPAAAAMTTRPELYAAKAARNFRPEPFSARFRKWLFSGSGRTILPVAMVAILALVIFIPRSPDPRFGNLAMIEAPAYVPIQVRSGGNTPWLAHWESGMSHYRNRQYDAASEDLGQAISLLKKNPSPETERYAVVDNAFMYLGVSSLLADRPVEAVRALEVAAESQLKPVSQKALWYLSQAYLLTEEPDKALQTLVKLENSPVFKARAASLVKEINQLAGE